MTGLSVANFRARFGIALLDNWTIIFGAAEGLTNRDLTQKLI
jgi:hypothetical protein